MKKIILASCAILAASFATQAGAQQGTVNGAAGGAVTGAIVGAVAGTAIDPPPREVVTYVQEQPAPTTSVVVEQPIAVGKPIPQSVVVTPVPSNPRYAYTVVNNQRVIVDPQTHTVVQVLR
ncbi:DUF1236 domain-containing protein [Neorhizobium galegae]|uniref:DUF1236 domain-containing protein n=1 Tax=Neorhizobium galegae TaxID=399 RepID=A0A6A1TXA4_NEOGA|nr:DUF1236 domain-containing protein [Neorhizobium galegae]KAB1089108.1 DUF1236 domain-containing protein [Neorhizobium galegae]